MLFRVYDQTSNAIQNAGDCEIDVSNGKYISGHGLHHQRSCPPSPQNHQWYHQNCTPLYGPAMHYMKRVSST